MGILTSSAASNHPQLQPVAHLILELNPSAPTMLLHGQELISVHKVRKQVNGPCDAPYAQKLNLGWVIVGKVCLEGVHKPTTVNTFYTSTKKPNAPPSLSHAQTFSMWRSDTIIDNVLTIQEHMLQRSSIAMKWSRS